MLKKSCEQALVEAELGTLLRFYLSQITDDLSARNFAPEFVDTLSNRLGRATRFEDWGQADLLGKQTGCRLSRERQAFKQYHPQIEVYAQKVKTSASHPRRSAKEFTDRLTACPKWCVLRHAPKAPDVDG